ncbi:MAG: hypothetical protein KGY70_16970 [Bacteroidales bacterium]|nr:hypothetical protein [Bacteroidales bacterium]
MTRLHQKHREEQMGEKPYPICRMCGKPATHSKEIDKDVRGTPISFKEYYCEDCLYDEYLINEEHVFPLSFGEYLKLENYKEL